MEKKKINYLYIIIGILLILLTLGGVKTLKNHHEKEYLVINNKILEKSKECYLKKECDGEITLKDLYDKGYLDTQFDPITKEQMDQNTCIKFENNKASFCKKD